MSLKYKALMSGEKELLALLGELPDRIQNRVFRHAGRKVGNAVAQRAAALTPKNTGKRKTNGKHLKESFINKQKTYKATATTVNIVGVQSRLGHPGRVNHLVEEGTERRFTNSRSKYKRVVVPVTVSKKVRTKNGGYRTIKVAGHLRKQKSIGSFARGTNVRASEATGRNRGVMPAFYQLAKAAAETNAAQIYETEIRAGLQRIADRNAAG